MFTIFVSRCTHTHEYRYYYIFFSLEKSRGDKKKMEKSPDKIEIASWSFFLSCHNNCFIFCLAFITFFTEKRDTWKRKRFFFLWLLSEYIFEEERKEERGRKKRKSQFSRSNAIFWKKGSREEGDGRRDLYLEENEKETGEPSDLTAKWT